MAAAEHSAPRRTLPQVLAAFDRAIGLDVTPRAWTASTWVAEPGATPQLEAPTPAPTPRPVAVARPATIAAVAAPHGPAAIVDAEPHAFDPRVLRGTDDHGGRSALLADIEARHAARCPHCTRSTTHRSIVFGEGSPGAKVFFVGEAPGETEDLEGRPFVGQAGQKLDEMIAAMGLARADAYIANVLKTRPPGNRTPLPDEAARCGPYLVEQILAVRPTVLVTLGGSALRFLLGVETGITRVRGNWHEWKPPAGADLAPIPVMPTYHPAYILRTYTLEVRRQVWSDLKAVMDRAGLPATPPS